MISPEKRLTCIDPARMQRKKQAARGVDKPLAPLAPTGLYCPPLRSDYVQIDIVVCGHRLERFPVERCVEDRRLLLRREMACEIGPEFLDQQRDAVGATALMADRIFDGDFLEPAAVVEFDRPGAGD